MRRKKNHVPRRTRREEEAVGLSRSSIGPATRRQRGTTQTANRGKAGRAGKNRGVLRRDAVGQPGPGVPRRSHCDVARVGGLRGTHLLVVLLLLWGRSHQENPNGEPAHATAHLEEERRSSFLRGSKAEPE